MIYKAIKIKNRKIFYLSIWFDGGAFGVIFGRRRRTTTTTTAIIIIIFIIISAVAVDDKKINDATTKIERAFYVD